ncbi:CDT1-like protein a, chloroplastic [Quillaja saponaria]|uniref:CDT1-like protein a, chloroplastic n=1 Tax=Quillaja saponaria TaxID=32244 RepID=A0AAD7VEK2_QUISA|nr:CDT1-like protein a, chloroplastic [Quillaja saponaria]
MSSSGTSLLPFRSKKHSVNHSDSKPQSPKPNQLSSKTPEKHSQLPRRSRNSGTALSLKEIRKDRGKNVVNRPIKLPEKRFTHGHLAQLKFILPEVIELKKVLVLDDRTSCIKPDIHVTVNADATDSDGKLTSECGNMSARKFFHAQLTQFLKSRPEGDEIPQVVLPEPFNHSKQTHQQVCSPLHVEQTIDGIAAQPLAVSARYMQEKEVPNGTLTPSL